MILAGKDADVLGIPSERLCSIQVSGGSDTADTYLRDHIPGGTALASSNNETPALAHNESDTVGRM